MEKKVEKLDRVTIRFAGDSGDGMQLSGTQFSNTSGTMGNDVNTFPDYPSEIRAPEGTLYGVSAYQIQFSSTRIHTYGDRIDVLVAMNASSLKVNLPKVRKGGLIIANTAGFGKKNLELAKYETNPLDDGSLKDYKVVSLDMVSEVREALKGLELSPKNVDRSKNIFALGITYWLFDREMNSTEKWLQTKFGKKPALYESNKRVLQAGYEYAKNSDLFPVQYKIEDAKLEKGIYRNITGNEACAIGLTVGAKKANLPLFLGSYPITPATEILHWISGYKKYGVKHLQAEDEIAGISSAIGASFAGYLAATTTSGPGLSLKVEAIGLAVILELPLVIIDVQRGGPSTGLPTKPEQSDLLMAMYGRHGEAPVPIVAARSAADCFYQTIEAIRIALKYMTPVILLTDGYLAQGTSPFKVPKIDELPDLSVKFWTDPKTFQPYKRDPVTLARPWAVPGTQGLEHRIGGLEKEDLTGLVSQDPLNHQKMVNLRAAKIEGIVNDIPPAVVEGEQEGDLLVIGWGGTYGAITDAYNQLRSEGKKLSYCHLVHLNPLPSNLGDILKRFKRVLVPELNSGQLRTLLQAKYLRPILGLNKVQGLPLKSDEVEDKINELLEEGK
ncbi:2-oxoacid:acceptor oxidoreductase subunit alpha [Bacteroidetes/Chlorobi group bacterium ChocPot_Mid]|jgi:2-oxoglutarate ferredoxin oxidoreductase subunit alpha|nr:MAG: 2-oxoacid:acceptor oxidoreductase subunit alpha [Bacteroidetes/Chlorobi group bacterium ChocPot_Mid]